MFIQPPMPSDTVLKKDLMAIAEEMWLAVCNIHCVHGKSLVFASFAGRTAQLLRLKETTLPSGTHVVLKERIGRRGAK